MVTSVKNGTSRINVIVDVVKSKKACLFYREKSDLSDGSCARQSCSYFRSMSTVESREIDLTYHRVFIFSITSF